LDKQKYFQNINSLRAIACLLIVFYHSVINTVLKAKHLFNPFFNGSYGVDLFFVLSGFLITNILINEFYETETIKIGNFYKRRILRLYPPILIAVVIFLIPMLFYDFRMAISNIFFLITYTGDCVLLFRNFIPYLQYPLAFSHSWSLSIEEQYYLIFPLIFLFLLKYLKKKINFNFISTFLIFNFIFVAVIVIFSLVLKDHFYKFFLWRFFEIFFGVYISLIFSNNYNSIYQDTARSKKIKNLIVNLFKNKIVLCISILIFFYLIFTNGIPHLDNLNYYVFTIVSAILIVNAAFNYCRLYNYFLSNKILRYFGKISYGVYLYHYPVFYLYNHSNFHKATTIKEALLLECVRIPAVVLLSILSYEFVESPILKLKKNFYNYNKIQIQTVST
jgi:peptidoglycan/LPS O-acetylase OafA/YrhL